jgi:NAD(P)-dependent dehydrogenase (short-subunit alcohol dehydrogenase family)
MKEGALVAICGRNRESVDQAVSAMKPLGRVFGVAADVTKIEQVQKFFQAVDDEFEHLDILVNNAGAGVFRKVAEMTPEEWHRNIDLNLNGPFYCAHEALPRFAKRGGGSIINISSLAGKNAFSGGAGYNASKFGLNGFSEALMLDHRQDNVRVSYIMPGSVDTEFSGGPGRRGGDTSWMIAAEDVAEAVALVLGMPARTMVSRIEMRPSRPPK